MQNWVSCQIVVVVYNWFLFKKLCLSSSLDIQQIPLNINSGELGWFAKKVCPWCDLLESEIFRCSECVVGPHFATLRCILIWKLTCSDQLLGASSWSVIAASKKQYHTPTSLETFSTLGNQYTLLDCFLLLETSYVKSGLTGALCLLSNTSGPELSICKDQSLETSSEVCLATRDPTVKVTWLSHIVKQKVPWQQANTEGARAINKPVVVPWNCALT